ncbi:ABC transporter permease [Scopulibacillus cellulosilyticus]|uniref:ABC transporter permease n=1 Tax=Scopulibacillus cellulosilyticus TaxID=2665665 RepID=A0ABW2PX86_9BACL
MSRFYGLIQNEMIKIFQRTRTWVLIAALVFCDLVFAIVMKKFTHGTGMVYNVWDFCSDSTNLLIGVNICGLVIAGDIVASEFAWGTIKLLLIRPIKRYKILLSKYVTVLLFTVFLLLLLYVFSLIFGAIFFGFSHTLESIYTLAGTFLTYSNQSINILISLTFAFMLSTAFRSSSLSISLSIMIVFLSKTVVEALSYSKITWGKYIVFSNTDFSQFTKGEPLFTGMTPGFSITVLLIYYLAFLFISWLVFTKRDVAV